jgi:hypothetical protein
MKDKEKIQAALIQLRKLRFKDGKTDYELGVGSMADLFLNLISSHANSFEYRDALNVLNEIARNAKKNMEDKK